MDDMNSDDVDLTLMEPVYEKYKDQPGTLIPILQKAQEIYGYLPMEVLRWIADRFDMAVGKAHGVATFYSQFNLDRRGKHVLKFCDGTACHVKGSRALAKTVEEAYHVKPGETTEDGELSVEIVYCLGSCALAPVTVLDDEIIGRVERDDLLSAIERRLDSDPRRDDPGESDGNI
jgi:NADH-quinone oxidoreductase subunit E